MRWQSSNLREGNFIVAMFKGWSENIIPIFQPPHSAELNPIERFWQVLKTKLQWENCLNLTQLRSYANEFAV